MRNLVDLKFFLFRHSQRILKKYGYRLVDLNMPDGIDLYKKYFSQESISNKRFYNVCAGGHTCFGGEFSHPLWRNLDYMNKYEGWGKTFDSSKDIEYNILEKQTLPIEDNSAEIIQFQYSIEHIPDDIAAFFLKEVYRALKPGGVFKIVTPNSELDYLAYINKDYSYYTWIGYHSRKSFYEPMGYRVPLKEASYEQIALAHFAGNVSTIHIGGYPIKISDTEFSEVMKSMKMEDALEYCTSRCSLEVQKSYRLNHMNWWTHEKLNRFLLDAGFKKNYIMAPCQSSHPVLRNNMYFDNLWNFVALFMETRK